MSPTVQCLSPKEIARLVDMRRLLGILGFSLHERWKRCPCVLHSGINPTAFSWREDGLWFCFVCGLGGDRIALVMAVKRCGFRDAVTLLASLVGVKFYIGRKSEPGISQSLQARERAEKLSWEIQDEIVLGRGAFRDRLLRAERIQQVVAAQLLAATTPADQDRYWSYLARLAAVTTYFLAGLNYLNYADTAALIRFARAPLPERRKIILAEEGLI
jgi:hypothetical protein